MVEHLTFNQVVRGSSPRCLINSSRVISMNLLVTRFFVFEEVNAMIIGFIIVSVIAVIFLSIGISCRKSREAVGFFTFVKPPIVEDVKHYNNAVSILWFVVAGMVEILGITFLFLQQNSPIWIFVTFGVMILVIVMIIAYLKIETKYKK